MAEIPRNALFKLCPTPLHLGAREVPIAVVHGFEFTAVDGNAGFRQQAHLAAEFDKACAHLADRTAIVLPEIRNRLVVGDKPAHKPHHLNVAPGVTLEPAARLNPVEIAVNIELQQHRRMIRRPTGHLGINPTEPQLGKIECIDKDVDHPNGIILVNPVFQAVRKQRALPAIRPSTKRLIRSPANRARIILANQSSEAFSHSQGHSRTLSPYFQMSALRETGHGIASLFHRHCFPVRLSCGGCSFQFGRTSTRLPPPNRNVKRT